MTNEYISNAIEQWEIGDGLIKELLRVGEETHYHIQNSTMSKKEQAILSFSKIDALLNRLNEAEVLFSTNISEAIHLFWSFKPWHDAVMDAAANFFINNVISD